MSSSLSVLREGTPLHSKLCTRYGQPLPYNCGCWLLPALYYIRFQKRVSNLEEVEDSNE